MGETRLGFPPEVKVHGKGMQAVIFVREEGRETSKIFFVKEGNNTSGRANP